MKANGLASLQAWKLKYLAFLTGLPSTGTKEQLIASIAQSTRSEAPSPIGRKVVSVDMGIRNLAFCAVEPTKDSYRVTAWRRMDLLARSPAAQSKTSTRDDETLNPASETSIFTPAALSQTALQVTQDLLRHTPTTLLIERQRFRSGGAAAIQEWTVRVNMLESMLWASLTTLRHANTNPSRPFPELHAVSPAQVAKFWGAYPAVHARLEDVFVDHLDVQQQVASLASSRKKVEKKEKVDLVRSWVAGKADVTVKLDFVSEATQIAEAFGTGSKQTKAVRDLAGGKLDDLADCLLQAVAWIRWQENRIALREVWETAEARASR